MSETGGRMAVDINCDIGEGFGIYRCGDDAGIMPLITVANVACGFHASDPTVMRKTVRLARDHGVKIGAHPSYPDRQGFGRRYMRMEREELVAALIYQVGALKGFLDAEGLPLHHVKPHGALYGAACREPEVAHAIAEAAKAFGAPVVGLSGTLQERAYRESGVEMIREVYVDLEYSDDGQLIITREHEAVAPDLAVERALRALQDGRVRAQSGREFEVGVDSICVHSDTPNAVAIATAVRAAVAPWM